MCIINESHDYCEKFQTFFWYDLYAQHIAYMIIRHNINTFDMFRLAALIIASRADSYEDYSNKGL